jgi:phosphatidylglycerol:prolipoprotein diacylglycerol transferase
LEGLLFFAVVNSLFSLTRIRLYRGALTGIAIMWYGIARFIVEFFREPDYQVGYLWLDLTMGQLLSVPMVLLGIIICLSALNLKFMEKLQ